MAQKTRFRTAEQRAAVSVAPTLGHSPLLLLRIAQPDPGRQFVLGSYAKRHSF
jgi:hypothetical protein